MTSDLASFGAVLRRLRGDAALSQEELAERAGLSVRGISDLERGVHTAPHLHTVRRLAEALDLPEGDRTSLLTAARPRPHDRPGAPGTVRSPLRLPHPLTRLVGREAQLASLLTLLRRDDVRLVTLTGAGGIGKTRFALEAAMSMAGEFADGVVFVDLAPVRDPANVLATVASALEVRDAGPHPLLEMVRDALAPRHLLLLLDNFEHVLSAAPLVTDMLGAAPLLKALVTGRHALRVRGEREFAVPPLELPDSPLRATAEAASRSDAVTLFVERAQDIRFDFALTDGDAPAVAEIVIQLDGLPLAIELAAAWSRDLAPPVLASRLGQRLPLLSSGARDAPARHRTMRAAIAWSYDLLSPPEQSLFRQLSVFAGGFTFEAAVDSDPTMTRPENETALTRLVDQNLIQVRGVANGGVRYDMLATVREFAREQLAACGEASAACDRHAARFLRLAESATPRLHGPRQLASLALLTADDDNLRAALDWTVARGQGDVAIRFGAHLWLFWLLHGRWTEGRSWLRRVLALPTERPSVAHAEVLFGAGNLAGSQGDLDEAGIFYESSLAECRAVGSRPGIARALAALGFDAVHRLEFAPAVPLLREAIPLYELPRDEPWVALTTSILGVALTELGDLAGGLAQAQDALTRQQAFGEHWAMASACVYLGHVLVANGEYQRAAALFAQALRNWSTPGITSFVLWPLAELAGLASRAERALDAARLIGLHDVVAVETRSTILPYYTRILAHATETAIALSCSSVIEAERSVARSVPLDGIAAEALHIASDLGAGA